jgi:lipopolysaccharide export system permease protein
MGAIVNFLGLARSSELVVVRAAGRSGLRFLVTPLLVAVLLGCRGGGAVQSSGCGNLEGAMTTMRAALSQGGRIGAVGGRYRAMAAAGIGETGQTVIQAARSGLDGTELFGVTFLTFRPGRPADYQDRSRNRDAWWRRPGP